MLAGLWDYMEHWGLNPDELHARQALYYMFKLSSPNISALEEEEEKIC